MKTPIPSLKIVVGALAVLLWTLPASAARKHHHARPQKPSAFTLGLADMDRHDYDSAIKHMTEASNLRDDGASYFMLGLAHFRKGFAAGSPETADKHEAAEAVNAFSMALALDPKLETITQPHLLYHGLALGYESLGANDKALQAYKRAIASAPKNAVIPLYAARLRQKMGDQPKSVANLELALANARAENKQNDLIALIKSSPLFASLSSAPDQTKVLAEASAPAKAQLTALSVQAQSELSQGGYGLRDSVKDTAPGDSRPSMHLRDQAVLDQLSAANERFRFRRFREAIAAYEQVFALNELSGVLSNTQTSFVHERIGICYNRLGLSAQAIEELALAVQRDSQNPSAHYQLALAYAVSGKFSNSLKSLGDTFKSAASNAELRRYALLSRTDAELDPIRDMPGFKSLMTGYAPRLKARA